jgi:amino acid transporter
MSDFDASPKAYKHDNEIVKDEAGGRGSTASTGEAGLGEIEETRNGQFHRSFSPRQVHVRTQ